jgi:hypothetical protein
MASTLRPWSLVGQYILQTTWGWCLCLCNIIIIMNYIGSEKEQHSSYHSVAILRSETEWTQLMWLSPLPTLTTNKKRTQREPADNTKATPQARTERCGGLHEDWDVVLLGRAVFSLDPQWERKQKPQYKKQLMGEVEVCLCLSVCVCVRACI